MSFKHLELLEEVSYDELPDTIKGKIDNFQNVAEEYDEIDEDDEENESVIRDMELKMEALDEGLYADLNSYIANKKKKAEEDKNKTPKEGDDDGSKGGDDTPPPAEPTSGKPSWRFW